MISAKALQSKRKYAIIFAFIVAAFLTPPDVISQIGLAGAVIALYEISILFVRYFEKQNAAENL